MKLIWNSPFRSTLEWNGMTQGFSFSMNIMETWAWSPCSQHRWTNCGNQILHFSQKEVQLWLSHFQRTQVFVEFMQMAMCTCPGRLKPHWDVKWNFIITLLTTRNVPWLLQVMVTQQNILWTSGETWKQFSIIRTIFWQILSFYQPTPVNTHKLMWVGSSPEQVWASRWKDKAVSTLYRWKFSIFNCLFWKRYTIAQNVHQKMFSPQSLIPDFHPKWNCCRVVIFNSALQNGNWKSGKYQQPRWSIWG